MRSTSEPLAAKLERLVRAEQREQRLPSLAAAVFRRRSRRLVWAGYPVTREPGPWRAAE